MAHWYFGTQGASGVSVRSFGNRTVITLPNNLTIVATGGSVSFTSTSHQPSSPSGRCPRFQGYRDFRDGGNRGRNRRRGRGRGRGQVHHPGPRGPVHANGTTEQQARAELERQGRANGRQQQSQGAAQTNGTNAGTGPGLIARAIASASASASVPVNSTTTNGIAGQLSSSAPAPGSGFGERLSSAGPGTGTGIRPRWTPQSTVEQGQLVAPPVRPQDYAPVGRDYVLSQQPEDEYEDEEWKIVPSTRNGYDGGLEGDAGSNYMDLTIE